MSTYMSPGREIFHEGLDPLHRAEASFCCYHGEFRVVQPSSGGSDDVIYNKLEQ